MDICFLALSDSSIAINRRIVAQICGKRILDKYQGMKYKEPKAMSEKLCPYTRYSFGDEFKVSVSAIML
jgi:stage III sporulation protein SpoIIIAA